jgi:hypothetical protein
VNRDLLLVLTSKALLAENSFKFSSGLKGISKTFLRDIEG